MPAISFRFLAGRYHATPWGRHVNEAEVEWPPSPWRVQRALVATWHRKADPERHPEGTLDGLMRSLAEEPPDYRVPRGVRSHSRHYMPLGKFKQGREETSLVFDAFMRVDPDERLIMSWPGVSLDASERLLLEELLRQLGFLGRAESWVEAELLEEWDGEANCFAVESDAEGTTDGTEALVRLIAPIPPRAYESWRQEAVVKHGLTQRRLKKAQRNLLATLPERFLDTYRVETGALHEVGWSSPPGTRFVTYSRPSTVDSIPPPTRSRPQSLMATTARVALTGRPLPLLEDSVKVGEVTRQAAIKSAEAVGSGEVPKEISGHELPEGNRHGHAFYLPEDADLDGHIDHVLVHAPDGLTEQAIRAIDAIPKLYWDADGATWETLFEGAGEPAQFTGSPLVGEARCWRSLTPYLHPWFAKRNFGVPEQLARECRERGLPEPDVSILPPKLTGPDERTRRPVHFHRFRTTKKRLRQPDTRGRFVELAFPEPVQGPLALGFGCHFGLGMFFPPDLIPWRLR